MVEEIIDATTALVFLMILGFLVFLLNTFASIVLIINVKKRSRLATLPILWILAANILIGLFPLPIYGLKKYGFEDVSLSGRICDAWRYSYFLCIHLALVSLLIMTVEKIFILMFVLRYKEMLTVFRMNIIFGISWLFFVVFDVIPFFPLNEYDDEKCQYYVKKNWALAMNILTMAIPLPLILCCYGYMIHLAYKQTIRINRESISDGKRRKTKIRTALEIKATRTVAFIVGAYILCWTPSTVYYLLVWLCPHCYPKNYQPHKTWIRFFFKLLNLFHAFLTPIIFCGRNRDFQKDAKKLLKKLTGSNEKDINKSVATMKGTTNYSPSISKSNAIDYT